MQRKFLSVLRKCNSRLYLCYTISSEMKDKEHILYFLSEKLVLEKEISLNDKKVHSVISEAFTVSFIPLLKWYTNSCELTEHLTSCSTGISEEIWQNERQVFTHTQHRKMMYAWIKNLIKCMHSSPLISFYSMFAAYAIKTHCYLCQIYKKKN